MKNYKNQILQYQEDLNFHSEFEFNREKFLELKPGLFFTKELKLEEKEVGFFNKIVDIKTQLKVGRRQILIAFSFVVLFFIFTQKADATYFIWGSLKKYFRPSKKVVEDLQLDRIPVQENTKRTWTEWGSRRWKELTFGVIGITGLILLSRYLSSTAKVDLPMDLPMDLPSLADLVTKKIGGLDEVTASVVKDFLDQFDNFEIMIDDEFSSQNADGLNLILKFTQKLGELYSGILTSLEQDELAEKVTTMQESLIKKILSFLSKIK